MTGLRFDRIARFFAARRTAANAQEATPDAEDEKKIDYLFVQSFEGGTIAPKDGEDGTYTLTLAHGLGQTVYFADRPSRDVGAMPTAQFLEGLGFPESNPPNAALVVDDGSGRTDIAVLELFNPLVDPDDSTVIYDVKVLDEWERSLEMGFTEAPNDLSTVPATFGNAHLFIDDCPFANIACWWYRYGHCSPASCIPNTDYHEVAMVSRNEPLCWNFLRCTPCEPYYHDEPWPGAAMDHWDNVCNDRYPDQCQGNCRAVI